MVKEDSRGRSNCYHPYQRVEWPFPLLCGSQGCNAELDSWHRFGQLVPWQCIWGQVNSSLLFLLAHEAISSGSSMTICSDVVSLLVRTCFLACCYRASVVVGGVGCLSEMVAIPDSILVLPGCHHHRLTSFLVKRASNSANAGSFSDENQKTWVD